MRRGALLPIFSPIIVGGDNHYCPCTVLWIICSYSSEHFSPEIGMTSLFSIPIVFGSQCSRLASNMLEFSSALDNAACLPMSRDLSLHLLGPNPFHPSPAQKNVSYILSV